MTREECEKLIIQKLKEIVAIYKKYNPKGKYLTLSMVDNMIQVNNAYYKEDAYRQINEIRWLKRKVKHDSTLN